MVSLGNVGLVDNPRLTWLGAMSVYESLTEVSHIVQGKTSNVFTLDHGVWGK